MKQLDFTFVILSYNSEKYIEKCLQSIDQAITALGMTAEIFVIDNGSVDETRRLIDLTSLSEMIKLSKIYYDCNTGTTYSRNQGLSQASGKYIVVLDSDAYVNKDVLNGLTLYLEDNPNCGIAAPKLVYPDGRFQISVDQFPTVIHKIKRFLFLKRMESDAEAGRQREVDYAISAFWMIPSEVVQKVGLMDEKIFYSPEDVDYCIRVWQAGYRIFYLPQFSAVHDAQEISRSKGFKLLNLFSFSHLKGLLYLYLKHHFIFSARKLRL